VYYSVLAAEAFGLIAAADSIWGTLAMTFVGAAFTAIYVIYLAIFFANGAALLLLGVAMKKHSAWWLLKWLLVIAAFEMFAYGAVDLILYTALLVVYDIIYFAAGVFLLLLAFVAIGKKRKR